MPPVTGSFDDILAANRDYAATFSLAGLAPPAAKGLGVLTCIDTRIEPLSMLGLVPGDAKILRNAGARVTDDALRSLTLATNLLAVDRIMVVAHTDCAAAAPDAELRARLAEAIPGVDLAGLDLLATPDQHATLRADVDRIRSCPWIASGVEVAGFTYDVDSGLLHEVT